METRFPRLMAFLTGPTPDQRKEAERRRKEAVEAARAAKDRGDTRGFHEALKRAQAALVDELRLERRP